MSVVYFMCMRVCSILRVCMYVLMCAFCGPCFACPAFLCILDVLCTHEHVRRCGALVCMCVPVLCTCAYRVHLDSSQGQSEANCNAWTRRFCSLPAQTGAGRKCSGLPPSLHPFFFIPLLPWQGLTWPRLALNFFPPPSP